MEVPVQHFFDEETKWLHSGGKNDFAPPGGIGKVAFDKLNYYAEKNLIFQIEGETGKEETYKEFLTKCIKIALYMRDEGLKAGDIISMCSQNNMNNFSVLIAAFFNGILLASTDPLISLTDAKNLLQIVEPKLMFACEKSMDVNTKATEEKSIKMVALYKHASLDNVPEILEKYTDNDVNSFVPYYAKDTKETALLLFSSGTTGLPKATCMSHDMLFENTQSPLPPQSRATIFTTLYWLTTVYQGLMLLQSGCIKVNIKDVAPEDLWKLIHNTKVNIIYFSYGIFIQSMPYLNQSLPYLKFILFFGGLVPLRFQEEIIKKIPDITLVNLYGTTEIGGVAMKKDGFPSLAAGAIVPKNVIVKIVDPDTEKAVDLNVVGEIRVKREVQLNGYYKRHSSDIWDSEGFYITGDLGYLDDNFELYFVDRIKEMFKFRGYHVIPEKIEKVLAQHPAVKQSIVVPVRHLTDDTHAKGLVVLKDGCAVDADELVKFTNDRIEDPRDHLRAGVQFINEADIPYTPTGKIKRHILKQKFAQ